MNRASNYFLFFLIATMFVSCDTHRKDKVVDDIEKQMELAMLDTTTVQVIDTLHNFGTVTEGNKVEYDFRFRNTGTKPLVIPTNPTASCGCTVPQKPEKPVMPGQIGFIKVVFNTQGKVGHNLKTIRVRSNALPDFPELVLTGEVEGNK